MNLIVEKIIEINKKKFTLNISYNLFHTYYSLVLISLFTVPNWRNVN